MGTPQRSPRPFSVEPLPETFINGTEGYIEAIQKLDKTLSRQTVLDAIKHEIEAGGGMLTQEAAAAILYRSLLEPEEPKGPENYTPTFATAAGQKVVTTTELEISKKLVEATGLSPDYFKVDEGSEGILVMAAKFLGDRWNKANEILEGMGFSYITDNKTKERMWVMNKPKPKEEPAPVNVEELYPKEPTPAKPKKQQALERPKTIRETEAILIDKFGGTILKSVVVTEDARSIDVEPQAKLPPKQQQAITELLAKYGGTMMDTGMPPGYVWVISK